MSYYSNLPDFGSIASPAKVFKVNWWWVGFIAILLSGFVYYLYKNTQFFKTLFNVEKQDPTLENALETQL